ncbi:twin-arginine translocase subunit TatC [Pedococcus sp. 5OH_020]|jgi:sec-independent protein translocase protein TatC|uniref:twin-arginine translocase subunit TatC n=1 Tax=Pedococcus sp. 5OH_020 TaxID=2989814 RepID=UPI0022E9E035|nr:twin-arginine translocase subunit TatC [Pedococcus sp. 5OH_020]
MAFRRARNPDARMSLGDHLRELRRRFLISAIAVLLCAVGGWVAYPQVYDRLAAPFNDYKASHPSSVISLNFGNATAAFSQQLSISIFVGILASSPVWLYQLWAFIVPGLTKKERRISLAFIGATVPLFLSGCALAYYVLPKVLAVLYGFTPAGASNIQQVSEYFSFVTRFIVAFGGAFLMPVFLVALNAIGVLPSATMLRAWRPAVFGIFVLSAVATPTPDAFTMFLMAIPLVFLYFAAVGVSKLIERSRRANRPEWVDVADDEASAL